MSETESGAHMETDEQHYASRFAWRRERQVFNLRELILIPESGGADPIEAFPNLALSAASENPQDALRWSIFYLINEATECFILGEFQSCILTCGAVVERVLKLEYEVEHTQLPKGEWTLGRCIHKLDWGGTRITKIILELANNMLEPRNNRAHALLEHSDPQLSILGGPQRGVEVRQAGYAIEPYRGDAKNVIEFTYKILAQLYGAQTSV